MSINIHSFIEKCVQLELAKKHFMLTHNKCVHEFLAVLSSCGNKKYSKIISEN